MKTELQCRGRVLVFVGECIGPEVHTIGVPKSHQNNAMTACARAVMSTHAPLDVAEEDNGNFFHGLTPKEVEAHLPGLVLTKDQRMHIEEIGESQAFQLKRAVPGAAKTRLGTGMVRAVLERLTESKKGLWLVQTRKQRDTQCAMLRTDNKDPFA